MNRVRFAIAKSSMVTCSKKSKAECITNRKAPERSLSPVMPSTWVRSWPSNAERRFVFGSVKLCVKIKQIEVKWSVIFRCLKIGSMKPGLNGMSTWEIQKRLCKIEYRKMHLHCLNKKTKKMRTPSYLLCTSHKHGLKQNRPGILSLCASAGLHFQQGAASPAA